MEASWGNNSFGFQLNLSGFFTFSCRLLGPVLAQRLVTALLGVDIGYMLAFQFGAVENCTRRDAWWDSSVMKHLENGTGVELDTDVLHRKVQDEFQSEKHSIDLSVSSCAALR